MIIRDGILFHNVEEMIPVEDGWQLCRFPEEVRLRLNHTAQFHAYQCGGVELRFRMVSEEINIYMRTPDDTEALPALIYFGGFQGSWDQSARTVGTARSCLHLRKPKNIRWLREAMAGREMIYDPDMVRIVLPCNVCIYMGIDGEVEPPRPGDATEKRLLSYGSSITHASLALGAHQSYAYQLARNLGYDSVNLGLAGSCHLEKEMAEYITSRKDWDVMTVEMGINMLGFTEEAFRERVRAFVDRMAADGRPVFVTSLFAYLGENQEKGDAFRRIVKEETEGKLPFIDGLELMGDKTLLAEDLVHPAVAAHTMIAQRWAEFIRKNL